MNVYIMTDIEGISGIYCREQVLPDMRRFGEGRELMTADVNACAAGLKAAGADKIYVRDCHGGSYTILEEKVSDDVDYLICGATGSDRFPGLEDCGAVILLGYHAMAGTAGAILEHSMSSATVQNYWINGVRSGETGIDAGICGERGVPVIMVSGDDKLCAEARRFIPGVYAAEVKKGITCFGGMLLPPAKARRLISDTAAEAYRHAADIRPLVWDNPVSFRVEVTERSQLPSALGKPYMTVIDGRTYEVTGDSMAEAFFRSL